MRTLLIVDDNESVLRTLEFVLSESGNRVRSALSGSAAVEIARSETIDAALVDLHMPVMDGFQTCSALLAQAHEGGRPLHVWLMTGGFSSAAEKRTVEIGAVALLAKPFSHVDFLASVEQRCAEPPKPPLAAPMSTCSPMV